MRYKPSTQDEIHAAQALIAQLAERWPKCFAVFERQRKPLKIGIDVDLVNAGVAPELLPLAMRLYCTNVGYLRAVMRRGERVDLDGNACGAVNEQAVTHAAHQLERRAARKARPVPIPAPEPIPTVTPTPKRITLADLREAARLRKQKALEQQSAEAS